MYLARLDSTGATILYATYFGGSDDDAIFDPSLTYSTFFGGRYSDGVGDIGLQMGQTLLVGGWTHSDDFYIAGGGTPGAALWSFARFAIDDRFDLDERRDMYGIEVRLVEVDAPAFPNTIVDRGPTYLRVISFDWDETSDMVTQLGLSFTTDVFDAYFDDFYDNSYQYGFNIDVIEVGCLGIKNGAPTNPFAN